MGSRLDVDDMSFSAPEDNRRGSGRGAQDRDMDAFHTARRQLEEYQKELTVDSSSKRKDDEANEAVEEVLSNLEEFEYQVYTVGDNYIDGIPHIRERVRLEAEVQERSAEYREQNDSKFTPMYLVSNELGSVLLAIDAKTLEAVVFQGRSYSN